MSPGSPFTGGGLVWRAVLNGRGEQKNFFAVTGIEP